ncbi:MAG: hypothetical protein OXD36_14645 [Rhodobacter sp.]|nr:hypothetical protein [Rhodobacter sp.]
MPTDLPLASVEGFAAPVALDIHLQNGDVVDDAVQGGHRLRRDNQLETSA